MKRILVLIGCSCFTMAAFGQAGDPENLNNKLVGSTVLMSATAKSDVIISPNPVKSQNFSIDLKNLEKGKYNIYIFNEQGKRYLLKTFVYEGGSSTQVLTVPQKADKGIYILQVLSKTSRFSKKMVID